LKLHPKFHQLSDISDDEVIIDIGCGTATYWQTFLRSNPNLKLTLIEPDIKLLEIAIQNYSHFPNVTLKTQTSDIPDHSFDKVFSFSVLEHVWNRKVFFSEAARLIKAGGVFHFNYDDGHFRNHLYRNRSMMYRVRNQVKTFLAPLWRFTHSYSRYQSSVSYEEVAELLHINRLTIKYEWFYDLEGLSKLSSLLKDPLLIEFGNLVEQFIIDANSMINSQDSKLSKDQYSFFWTFYASRGITAIKIK
jgi:ubiquinone/menaquinone biosynthesis C-methylase UbiE